MRKTLIALALVAALPLSAQAAKPSYTWVEGNYANLSDADTDGFGVRGSYAFGDSGFYGLAGLRRLSTDTVLGDADSTEYEIGGGYALGLTDQADLIAELAWQRAEVDVAGFDGSANGYRASVGTRIGFNDHVEGLAKVNYVDGNDIDGDTTGTLGLLVKFDRTWGATGEVEFDGDGGELYTVGLRASF